MFEEICVEKEIEIRLGGLEMNKSEQENIAEQTGKDTREKLTLLEWTKRAVIFIVGIIIVLFATFFCFAMYNDKIAIDSVVSLMLAFFSISISVLFFFKADEAGKNFYDSSYQFMKEQSKLLGEINVRFSEKFDNLSSNVERMRIEKNEKVQEVEISREEITDVNEKLVSELKEQNQTYQNTIEELQNVINVEESTSTENQQLRKFIEEMNSKMNSSQRAIQKYDEELKQKNIEYEKLQQELKVLENKYITDRLTHMMSDKYGFPSRDAPKLGFADPKFFKLFNNKKMEKKNSSRKTDFSKL